MKFLRSPLILTILVTLLGAGAGLGAFWLSASEVIAQARAAQIAKANAGRPAKPWDFWTLEIDNLASELRADRAELEKRAEELAAREARLTAEAAELAQTRQQIEALRSSISEKVYEIQQAEEKNLKSLALTYSNLTPRSALAILNQLDEPTVVKLLALMKPEVSAALFEQMGQAAQTDPAMARRAATLSERLRLLKPAGKTAQNP